MLKLDRIDNRVHDKLVLIILLGMITFSKKKLYISRSTSMSFNAKIRFDIVVYQFIESQRDWKTYLKYSPAQGGAVSAVWFFKQL